LKQKNADLLKIISGLLSSVAFMLFQTGEAYYNIGLTKVTYNKNKLSMVEKGVSQRTYKFQGFK
jgi:hypothetical protein